MSKNLKEVKKYKPVERESILAGAIAMPSPQAGAFLECLWVYGHRVSEGESSRKRSHLGVKGGDARHSRAPRQVKKLSAFI